MTILKRNPIIQYKPAHSGTLTVCVMQDFVYRGAARCRVDDITFASDR